MSDSCFRSNYICHRSSNKKYAEFQYKTLIYLRNNEYILNCWFNQYYKNAFELVNLICFLKFQHAIVTTKKTAIVSYWPQSQFKRRFEGG